VFHPPLIVVYCGASVRGRTQYDVVLLEAAVPSVVLLVAVARVLSVQRGHDVHMRIVGSSLHLRRQTHTHTRFQLGGLGWLVDCVQLCTNFRLGHLAS